METIGHEHRFIAAEQYAHYFRTGSEGGVHFAGHRLVGPRESRVDDEGVLVVDDRAKLADIDQDSHGDATAGEGFYWKYESKLKTWDSELYSVVGAAGELFSIRTSLYVPVPPDSILDDFMISLLIAKNGYRIVYEPMAYATETGSESIKEELKRKIRIAAGGIQSILRLGALMNPFRHFVLSFQYVSHRVLRWTVTPFLMIAALVLNGIIAYQTRNLFYIVLFGCQAVFYFLSILGWLFDRMNVKIKVLFIPYYFCMMNYAVVAGIIRYIKGSQSVMWDKAKRK